MNQQELERIYQEDGRTPNPKRWTSRQIRNQTCDYCRARAAGKTPEQAMEEVAELTAKFAPKPQRPQVESDTDRQYRLLRESCQRTSLN